MKQENHEGTQQEAPNAIKPNVGLQSLAQRSQK